MDETAVFHSVTQNTVVKSIPFFDKAFIRERVYTETAQRHHDLIGAFDDIMQKIGMTKKEIRKSWE